ncbi:MAG TPA: ATP-binding cassette domain-containing protein [Cyclobacteriaceae bacterium]|nr:ATP-binding cassette domain-containing protein [Cyclobacteriaceae bacterium]
MKKEEQAFLSIENATVKHLGKVMFQQLSFNMLEGQSWAILAGSGSERTAFLETILGKTTLSEGRIRRCFAEAYQAEQSVKGEINSFRDLIAVVSQQYEFRNKSNVQDFYYQQRFNSSESEEAATVEEYLTQIEVKVPGNWTVEMVLQLLQLGHLRDKSLIKLSNGETRRLAIAGALMKNPKLLLMDQPMTGLDVHTRHAFGGVLQAIVASGIQVVMTTSADEIPEAISHVGLLKGGRLALCQSRQQFDTHGADVSARGQVQVNEKIQALVQTQSRATYSRLIKLTNIRIQYGEKLILDKLNWEVRQGERWALKGHNGAGKSTLLSLIFGENPQAYANDIILFDRKRGSGESIWDVKRPTGFVSAELSRYFPKGQSCHQVVLSGLFDTIGLFKKPNGDQLRLAEEWLDALDLLHVAKLRLHQVTLEQQRFCLLARAMIKSPALLVLDEAAQGMDEGQRVLFKSTVDEICRYAPITLIYVSHYEEDIPSCVTRRMVLKEGKIEELI